jgi:hypothetical protein
MPSVPVGATWLGFQFAFFLLIGTQCPNCSDLSCKHVAFHPAGARHEHRLKTTLLSKPSTGSQQQYSQQQYNQQQYSQQQYNEQQPRGGSSPPLHARAATVAAAAAAAAGRSSGALGNVSSVAVISSAAADFRYQQGWESVDHHYTRQQQQGEANSHSPRWFWHIALMTTASYGLVHCKAKSVVPILT